MLALTKNENGHARMLASARVYPISVATFMFRASRLVFKTS